MLLLEEIFKRKKLQHSECFNLRVQRSLSWFKKSLELEHDLDLQFISLWIALNALYVQDMNVAQDTQALQQLLNSIHQQDQEDRIDSTLWGKLSPLIARLLDNPYAYQAFWDYKNQKISQSTWQADFVQAKQQVQHALQEQVSIAVLTLLFNRLHTLANQLTHGGATYNSSMSRQTMQEACQILAAFLSSCLYVLLENAPVLDVGQPFYPIIQVC